MEAITKIQELKLTIQDFDSAAKILNDILGEFRGNVEGLIIVDDPGKEAVLLRLQEISTLKRELEARRKGTIVNSQNFIREVNGFVKPYISAIDEINNTMRKKVLGYERECEKRKLEAERLVREQEARDLQRLRNLSKVGTNTEKFQTDIAEQRERSENNIKSLHRAKTQNFKEVSSTVRKKWTYEITDHEIIPRKFLSANHGLIKHAIANGERNIPGIEIYQKEELAIGRN